ncbi:family 1 glycoside hydrolase [Hortaea werneckii]|nr:family 1 glycoside hydrolase [Hortaea werneckii]
MARCRYTTPVRDRHNGSLRFWRSLRMLPGRIRSVQESNLGSHALFDNVVDYVVVMVYRFLVNRCSWQGKWQDPSPSNAEGERFGSHSRHTVDILLVVVIVFVGHVVFWPVVLNQNVHQACDAPIEILWPVIAVIRSKVVAGRQDEALTRHRSGFHRRAKHGTFGHLRKVWRICHFPERSPGSTSIRIGSILVYEREDSFEVSCSGGAANVVVVVGDGRDLLSGRQRGHKHKLAQHRDFEDSDYRMWNESLFHTIGAPMAFVFACGASSYWRLALPRVIPTQIINSCQMRRTEGRSDGSTAFACKKPNWERRLCLTRLRGALDRLAMPGLDGDTLQRRAQRRPSISNTWQWERREARKQFKVQARHVGVKYVRGACGDEVMNLSECRAWPNTLEVKVSLRFMTTAPTIRP